MSWYLAPALAQLRRELEARWPGRDTTSDGSIGDAAHSSRRSDHNPDARGRVDAIDVDENPSHGSPLEDVGESLWQWLLDTKPRQVKYAIYEGRIVSSYDHADGRAWTPRPYSGVNPHSGHVHISVLDDHAEDPSPWGYSSAAPTPQEASMFCQLGDRDSDQVRALQVRLRLCGPEVRDVLTSSGDADGVDGHYGDLTAKALGLAVGRGPQDRFGPWQMGWLEVAVTRALSSHADTVASGDGPVPAHTHTATVDLE